MYLSGLHLGMQDPAVGDVGPGGQGSYGGHGSRAAYNARPGLDHKYSGTEFSAQEGYLNSQLSPISEGKEGYSV